MLAPWKKSNDKPRQCITKQRHYFADKGLSSQSYSFSSSHVWMWELDHKESWALKNWCVWCWRRLFESSLDCKKIQSVHPKGNQSWIFNGRTNAEAETPILWPPDMKSWLIRKDRDAGKDWRQEEKGVTENEMVGWHHWLNGHEFEQTPGDSDGQGSLACCSPQGCKESDTTEDWTELNCPGCPGWVWSNRWKGLRKGAEALPKERAHMWTAAWAGGQGSPHGLPWRASDLPPQASQSGS